jgi:hypothetical protein
MIPAVHCAEAKQGEEGGLQPEEKNDLKMALAPAKRGTYSKGES